MTRITKFNIRVIIHCLILAYSVVDFLNPYDLNFIHSAGIKQ